jgi:hypothetical protein
VGEQGAAGITVVNPRGSFTLYCLFAEVEVEVGEGGGTEGRPEDR